MCALLVREVLKKDFMIERGDARGVDFLLKYNSKKVSIWSVYSFGLVNREDELQVYSPHYDRTHNFNFVFSYVMDRKKLWDLKAIDKPTSVNFKILKIAKSYSPGDKFCQLCIAEKQLIIKEIKHNEKNSLNSRDELFSLCRHKERHKLNKVS